MESDGNSRKSASCEGYCSNKGLIKTFFDAHNGMCEVVLVIAERVSLPTVK